MLDKGGYTVQPVPAPPPENIDIDKIDRDGGVITKILYCLFEEKPYLELLLIWELTNFPILRS